MERLRSEMPRAHGRVHDVTVEPRGFDETARVLAIIAFALALVAAWR